MDHIEAHLQRRHQPGYYATILNITPIALGRISKQHSERKSFTGSITSSAVLSGEMKEYFPI
jgi:hypothetical protein